MSIYLFIKYKQNRHKLPIGAQYSVESDTNLTNPHYQKKNRFNYSSLIPPLSSQ